MRTIHLGEKGASLIIVLAFMALAVPLVTATLGLASTVSIDSRLKTARMKSHYNTIGAAEHAMYRLLYEAGYVNSLPLNQPVSYTIALNGTDVEVTVTKTNEPPPAPTVPVPESGRELRTESTVQPQTANPGLLTTFTFEITVFNMSSTNMTLDTIYDQLHSGFSYVSGSSIGITTNDPLDEGDILKWQDLNYTTPPEGSVTLTFQASATSTEGVYCNETYVDPGGRSKTTSGLTAQITVGSPGATLCDGAGADLTKSVIPAIIPSQTAGTFAYSISVENTGDVPLNLSSLRDLLPAGFTYVSGSSAGITSANPSVSNASGRWELTWAISPTLVLQPRETKTEVFQATATPASGQYYNDTWAIFDEIPYELYTWPTAPVEAMGVAETSSTDGKTTVNSVLWLGTASYLIEAWDLK